MSTWDGVRWLNDSSRLRIWGQGPEPCSSTAGVPLSPGHTEGIYQQQRYSHYSWEQSPELPERSLWHPFFWNESYKWELVNPPSISQTTHSNRPKRTHVLASAETKVIQISTLWCLVFNKWITDGLRIDWLNPVADRQGLNWLEPLALQPTAISRLLTLFQSARYKYFPFKCSTTWKDWVGKSWFKLMAWEMFL